MNCKGWTLRRRENGRSAAGVRVDPKSFDEEKIDQRKIISKDDKIGCRENEGIVFRVRNDPKSLDEEKMIQWKIVEKGRV